MPIKNIEKRKEYNKLYQLKNKEKIQQKHREWVLANANKQKEYHKNYHKEWYEKNKVQRRKELKEYQQNHRSEHVKRVQKYIKNNIGKVKEYRKQFEQSFSGRYRMYTYHAKKRGNQMLLSLQDFKDIVEKPCRYCGDSQKIGVDRINNTLGYTKENTSPCCSTCNYMKKAMSLEDFLSHVRKISKFNS